MTDLPTPKYPLSPDQEVTGPFHFVRGGVQSMWLSDLTIEQAVMMFVRYATPPVSNYGAAAIQDVDGIIVLGWAIFSDGRIEWRGVNMVLPLVADHKLVEPLLYHDIESAILPC